MEKELSISEAQRLVDDFITGIGGGYFSHLTNMALLTEEVGELARVIARIYGEQVAKPGDLHTTPKEQISEELADVMWVVICLANQTETDLTEALQASLQKKSKRDRNRFTKN